MKLSKTAHNSGCSGSCSLISVGCSPALSNVLHGAFHSNEKKRNAMQLRNKTEINQNNNIRWRVPNFYKPYLPINFSEAPPNWRFPKRPQNIEALFIFSQDQTENVWIGL